MEVGLQCSTTHTLYKIWAMLNDAQGKHGHILPRPWEMFSFIQGKHPLEIIFTLVMADSWRVHLWQGSWINHHPRNLTKNANFHIFAENFSKQYFSNYHRMGRTYLVSLGSQCLVLTCTYKRFSFSALIFSVWNWT